ncbi:hypothetical protein DPEC_G00111720 [Dallia pectoralis]|uniref:Uncharacterized protein n=1 Tax=Dallia pectoralis TaxID=75939 RepID=A0ACC2GT72_DALPE|nr:hypothetical protein DPEC_G00111720 [Dallia pectoralis]
MSRPSPILPSVCFVYEQPLLVPQRSGVCKRLVHREKSGNWQVILDRLLDCTATVCPGHLCQCHLLVLDSRGQRYFVPEDWTIAASGVMTKSQTVDCTKLCTGSSHDLDPAMDETGLNRAMDRFLLLRSRPVLFCE